MKRVKRSFLCAFLALSGVSLIGKAAGPQSWPMFGQNESNTAAVEHGPEDISPRNVGRLKPRWVATLGGDISARAAVVDGVVYVPDWAGNLWALKASNGRTLWSHPLSYYGLAEGTISRTTPAVANGLVYIGTQYNASGPTGWLLAIHAATGEKAWMVQPDTSNGFPVITASPTVVAGRVYVGMTSNEEFAAASSDYHCCSARGSVVALEASSGRVLWQTFMVPKGYSGGNVWGSNPVVDRARAWFTWARATTTAPPPILPTRAAWPPAARPAAACPPRITPTPWSRWTSRPVRSGGPGV